MSLFKNAWTAVVNLGWVAVLAVGLSKADFHAPPARAAQETPPPQTKVASKKATKGEATSPPDISGLPLAKWKRELPDIMADIQAEANRKKAEALEMQRIKDEAESRFADQPEPQPEPDPQLVGWSEGVTPYPAPNLHETHESGEPYVYSLARYQNNELRWTINEFHWRLGSRTNHGKKFWDLSDIDGPNLDAPLPRTLDGLKRQNWDLSWRASRLADMMNGQMPQTTWKLPPMPRNLDKVPIPRPSCNSDFCRVPAR